MSDSYKILDQQGMYFLTFQVVGWVDLFTRERYANIIIDSFKYCQENKGLKIHSWCIMSNHVHAILSTSGSNLSDVVRDFKRHTSKKIIEEVQAIGESRREWILFQFKRAAGQHKRNDEYQVWTHENHAVELCSNYFILQKLMYIHENPVVSGVVDQASHYRYSSARDYEGVKGLLSIEFIE